MGRKVFFSFKYEDVFRAMVVRNSAITKGEEAAGFIDKANFEKVKANGDPAIRNWIDGQLKGTFDTTPFNGR